MLNRLETVLGYVAYQAWAVGLGAFWFYIQIARTASSVPDPATGMTAGMSDHGEWFFVHPWKKTLFWVALFGGVAAFMIAVATMQNYFGKEALKKLRPKTLALAVIVAVTGWTLVIRVV